MKDMTLTKKYIVTKHNLERILGGTLKDHLVCADGIIKAVKEDGLTVYTFTAQGIKVAVYSGRGKCWTRMEETNRQHYSEIHTEKRAESDAEWAAYRKAELSAFSRKWDFEKANNIR